MNYQQIPNKNAFSSQYLILLPMLVLIMLIQGCTRIISAGTDEPIHIDPGRRLLGTYINDEKLETIAKVNINKAHPDLKKANISVNIFNGVALLTGQVADEELRRLAAETVNKITYVRQLHNELQIQGNISLLAQTNDTWLANKVKTKLLAHKDVEGSRIKVIAESGSIYLMGLVSRIEAEKITELVSTTSGVQQVVRVFEYIDVN